MSREDSHNPTEEELRKRMMSKKLRNSEEYDEIRAYLISESGLDAEVIKYRLANKILPSGGNILHLAVKNKDLDLVYVLLNRIGISYPNALDAEGKTAFDYAVKGFRMKKILREKFCVASSELESGKKLESVSWEDAKIDESATISDDKKNKVSDTVKEIIELENNLAKINSRVFSFIGRKKKQIEKAIEDKYAALKKAIEDPKFSLEAAITLVGLSNRTGDHGKLLEILKAGAKKREKDPKDRKDFLDVKCSKIIKILSTTDIERASNSAKDLLRELKVLESFLKENDTVFTMAGLLRELSSRNGVRSIHIAANENNQDLFEFLADYNIGQDEMRRDFCIVGKPPKTKTGWDFLEDCKTREYYKKLSSAQKPEFLERLADYVKLEFYFKEMSEYYYLQYAALNGKALNDKEKLRLQDFNVLYRFEGGMELSDLQDELGEQVRMLSRLMVQDENVVRKSVGNEGSITEQIFQNLITNERFLIDLRVCNLIRDEVERSSGKRKKLYDSAYIAAEELTLQPTAPADFLGSAEGISEDVQKEINAIARRLAQNYCDQKFGEGVKGNSEMVKVASSAKRSIAIPPAPVDRTLEDTNLAELIRLEEVMCSQAIDDGRKWNILKKSYGENFGIRKQIFSQIEDDDGRTIIDLAVSQDEADFLGGLVEAGFLDQNVLVEHLHKQNKNDLARELLKSGVLTQERFDKLMAPHLPLLRMQKVVYMGGRYRPAMMGMK